MATSTWRRGRLTQALVGVCVLGFAASAAIDGTAAATERSRGLTCGTAVQPDPFELYGDAMRFRVLRNGSPVGAHTVTFQRQGRDIVVETRFDVQVQLLFVTAYQYEYRAIDTWQNGCLIAMQAWINDDGARHEVVATSDGERLIIDGPRGRGTARLGVYPTHHWNAGVLGSDHVLNTITGRVANVRIVDQGIETVSMNGESRPARRFAYSGELQNQVWYDERGRWVKMRFQGTDGSTIEYVCEACAHDLTASR